MSLEETLPTEGKVGKTDNEAGYLRKASNPQYTIKAIGT